MTQTVAAKGQCLCGAVKVSVSEMSLSVGACHCNMCRQWSGGAWLTVDCHQEVHFEGSEHIATFSSSSWAERGFCARCGTHLYYHLKQNNQYIMSVGLFPEHAEYQFEHQVFIDEKPHYYGFVNETKNMTGAEIFAMYGPQEPASTS